MGQPVVHFEIMGSDARRLWSYYSELFGWEIDTDNPSPVDYGLVAGERDGGPEGGGIGGGIGAIEGSPGHVTIYVAVPEVEAALVRAEELGGKRVMGPHPVSEEFVVGLFEDPEGHLIGVTAAA